ncbi:hypothetical protein EFB14_31290 [Rhizobium fabae]|uniref:Uncharacterized protein n=1 Tax=Rhizobium fabae TaxID=573179 RepID=A0ABY0B085_9HYPH|nr:hypothetical protein EFB14_31290 [Rhizobium fabae]
MAFMEISFRPVVLLNVPARKVFLISNFAGRSGSIALAKIILIFEVCAGNTAREKPARWPACRSPQSKPRSGDGVEIELAVGVAVEIV